MSVALQRSISGDCNAHKHGCSGTLFSVPAIFDQTTVVISGSYVIRFAAEILITAEDDFLCRKKLCATLDGCIG
jgi:hypothetical protein